MQSQTLAGEATSSTRQSSAGQPIRQLDSIMESLASYATPVLREIAARRPNSRPGRARRGSGGQRAADTTEAYGRTAGDQGTRSGREQRRDTFRDGQPPYEPVDQTRRSRSQVLPPTRERQRASDGRGLDMDEAGEASETRLERAIRKCAPKLGWTRPPGCPRVRSRTRDPRPQLRPSPSGPTEGSQSATMPNGRPRRHTIEATLRSTESIRSRPISKRLLTPRRCTRAAAGSLGTHGGVTGRFHPANSRGGARLRRPR
jgi:hypothetical protein